MRDPIEGARAREPGMLAFQCNICGSGCEVLANALEREHSSCLSCGSTGRERAIIRALSTELFGESIALPNFPHRPDIAGLGMTDSARYAARLEQKLYYRNTYYHQEPRLDVSANEVETALLDSCDFVISSEVFEHVLPPVQRAFDNVFRILRAGGVFILTVPYGTQPHTIEHFPTLHRFEVIETNGSYRLQNTTPDGRIEEFRDLKFHQGAGATLEMRVFAEADLLQHLMTSGFTEIKVHRTPDFRHAVWWPQPWSLPISARKPRL